MTEPNPPPRRPLATFLRATPDTAGSGPPADDDVAGGMPPHDAAQEPDAPDAPHVDPTANAVADDAVVEAPVDAIAHVEAAAQDAPQDDLEDAAAADDAGATHAAPASAATAPSFTRAPAASPRTPRWQWGLVVGLMVVLALQIAVADRARLAEDAGTRPWVAGLCTLLRCGLPAWHEPTAFSMISRDVRPVPTQAGALQVQASFRNDARWAQGWPSLRLSLSDADGRVIGTSVFTPQDYLDPAVDAGSVLEPGQSAQIAFRVREPAASTVAFTFEFL